MMILLRMYLWYIFIPWKQNGSNIRGKLFYVLMDEVKENIKVGSLSPTFTQMTNTPAYCNELRVTGRVYYLTQDNIR
jgi:hypothetical protein